MPTVSAIALETFLEPGSSSSSGSHLDRGYGVQDPSPRENQIRGGAGAGRGSSASFLKENHHRLQPGVRREHQPIFLSRQPRDGSNVPVKAEGNGSLAAPAGSRARSTTNGYYISPQLYTTPEPTLIVPTGGISSSSPTSVSSPSPYVVNHKRRDVPRRPPPPTSTSNERVPFARINIEGSEVKTNIPDSVPEDTFRDLSRGTYGSPSEQPGDVLFSAGQTVEGATKTADGDKSSGPQSNSDDQAEKECLDPGMDDEIGDSFCDPREVMSTMSNSDTEDGSGSFRRSASGRCHTPLSGQSEFYDANEEFFSDGSSSRASPSIRGSLEADLRSCRLDLFLETERRRKAEDALEHVQNMIRRMGQLLFSGPLPAAAFSLSGSALCCDADSAAQVCQEIVVTRMVFEALEAGLVQAEAAAAADLVVAGKNHEIARLRDRLQYYEAVNQEMSQRNQEAIELARRMRQRKKVRRKWVMGCVGLSVAVGASLMAFSYLAAADGGDRLEPAEGRSA